MAPARSLPYARGEKYFGPTSPDNNSNVLQAANKIDACHALHLYIWQGRRLLAIISEYGIDDVAALEAKLREDEAAMAEAVRVIWPSDGAWDYTEEEYSVFGTRLLRWLENKKAPNRWRTWRDAILGYKDVDLMYPDPNDVEPDDGNVGTSRSAQFSSGLPQLGGEWNVIWEVGRQEADNRAGIENQRNAGKKDQQALAQAELDKINTTLRDINDRLDIQHQRQNGMTQNMGYLNDSAASDSAARKQLEGRQEMAGIEFRQALEQMSHSVSQLRLECSNQQDSARAEIHKIRLAINDMNNRMNAQCSRQEDTTQALSDLCVSVGGESAERKRQIADLQALARKDHLALQNACSTTEEIRFRLATGHSSQRPMTPPASCGPSRPPLPPSWTSNMPLPQPPILPNKSSESKSGRTTQDDQHKLWWDPAASRLAIEKALQTGPKVPRSILKK